MVNLTIPSTQPSPEAGETPIQSIFQYEGRFGQIDIGLSDDYITAQCLLVDGPRIVHPVEEKDLTAAFDEEGTPYRMIESEEEADGIAVVIANQEACAELFSVFQKGGPLVDLLQQIGYEVAAVTEEGGTRYTARCPRAGVVNQFLDAHEGLSGMRLQEVDEEHIRSRTYVKTMAQEPPCLAISIKPKYILHDSFGHGIDAIVMPPQEAKLFGRRAQQLERYRQRVETEPMPVPRRSRILAKLTSEERALTVDFDYATETVFDQMNDPRNSLREARKDTMRANSLKTMPFAGSRLARGFMRIRHARELREPLTPVQKSK